MAAPAKVPTAPREVVVFAHLLEPRTQIRDFVPAGILRQVRQADASALPEFQYGRLYAKRPHAFSVDPVALNVHRPPNESNQALSPVAGLSEFGGIRDAAPDAWGRRVIEAKLRVPPNSLDEFTYLLHAGMDRVGALDVRRTRSDGPVEPAGMLTSIDYLVQAVQLVEAGHDVPAHLVPYLAGAPSAGGARPKASVRDEQGVLWLAKFPAQNDTVNMAVLEAGTLHLAAQAGLSVPPVRTLQLHGRSVMLIRRFDRYWAAPGELLAPGAHGYDTEPQPGWEEGRLPQVSALTMLACAELDSTQKSYKDIAHAIQARVLPKFIARDKEELFARLVFNIFVHNDDDHLRNHAFNYDPLLKGWRLSPLYDVVPRASFAYERLLHLGVGTHGRLATLDNAMTEFAAFLPSRSKAVHVVRRVWGALRQWKNTFDELGADRHVLELLDNAIRPLQDIASAELVKEVRQTASWSLP